MIMSKTLAIVAITVSIFTGSAAIADTVIEIPGHLPDADTCETAWAGAGTPEGAAAVFVAALITYEVDEDLARDCMRRIVDDGYLSNGDLSHDFNYLIDVGIERWPEIARSYVQGAEPSNGYALPEAPWQIVFTRDARYDLGGEQYRVKIVTSGQPSSRPITVRRDTDDLFRINEASTLFVGVAAPQ